LKGIKLAETAEEIACYQASVITLFKAGDAYLHQFKSKMSKDYKYQVLLDCLYCCNENNTACTQWLLETFKLSLESQTDVVRHLYHNYQLAIDSFSVTDKQLTELFFSSKDWRRVINQHKLLTEQQLRDSLSPNDSWNHNILTAEYLKL